MRYLINRNNADLGTDLSPMLTPSIRTCRIPQHPPNIIPSLLLSNVENVAKSGFSIKWDLEVPLDSINNYIETPSFHKKASQTINNFCLSSQYLQNLFIPIMLNPYVTPPSLIQKYPVKIIIHSLKNTSHKYLPDHRS
jgi:hypothetical protein